MSGPQQNMPSEKCWRHICTSYKESWSPVRMLEASRFAPFSHHFLYLQLHNGSLAIRASSFGRSTLPKNMDVVTLEKYDAIYEIYSNIRVYYVHVIPIDNWIFLPKPTPTNHSSHLKAPLIWWEFGGRARAPHTLDRGTKAPLSNGIDILKCGQWFKWWNWCGKVFLHFPWTLVELAIHLWHGIIWKDGQQQKLQRVPWMWNPKCPHQNLFI